MSVMKKIALCIPTYKRTDSIEKFLNHEIENLKEFCIDLFIFDSSEDDCTKNIVNSFLPDERVRYIKMDSFLSSAEKVFQIYQKFENSNYDYVWMTHDHTEIKKEAFKSVLMVLDENADFYVINMHASDYIKCEISNLDEFMVRSAWILRRFGAAIISVKGVINGTQWNDVQKKYLKKEVSSFSHVGYYLDRMSQLQNIKCMFLGIPHEYFLDYTRVEKSSWYYDTLRLSTECWGKIILGQSSKYSRAAKKQTLKSGGKTTLTLYKLLSIKKDKKYDLLVYIKYFKWIIKIFSVRDVLRFGVISVLPYSMSIHLYNKKIRKIIEREQSEGNKVVIYGAGRFASECAARFDGANVNYDGFIVKTNEDNPDSLYNHNIYIAEDYIKNNNCFIVIAVARNGVDGVKDYLNRIESKKKITYIEFGDL